MLLSLKSNMSIAFRSPFMSLDNGKVEMYLTSSEFNIFISVGTYISRGRFISFSCHDVSI